MKNADHYKATARAIERLVDILVAPKTMGEILCELPRTKPSVICDAVRAMVASHMVSKIEDLEGVKRYRIIQ